MLIASGIAFVLFGLLGFVGQLISTVNFEFAQKTSSRPCTDQIPIGCGR